MNTQGGFGKKEITCFIPGIGMMGYGQPHNTVKEIGTPLFARAMYLQQEDRNLLLVHLELAFVTLAIKEEVLTRLQKRRPEWEIQDENLLVCAQHTHSAPGGYSHYPFYNFTIPGFQHKVFNTICEGIIEAIEEAYRDLAPVTLGWGKHALAENLEVAFNRSMGAYLNNSDSLKLKLDESHLGINREMEGIIIKNSKGELRAILNWFGVHATSISSFNHKIHHDNKGVAASLFEKHHPGTIAFFLQAAAGDVSPNFIWDPQLKRTRGKFKDQYENAQFNGEIQFREAEKIQETRTLTGPITCLHQFVDMSAKVAVPAHGVAFFRGTKEGPGVNDFIAAALKSVSRFIQKIHLLDSDEAHQKFYSAHWPKDIVLDHRSGAFLGIPLKVWKRLPPIPEPAVDAFRKCARNESINTLPWVPHVLPIQLIMIGPVMIAAVPGEITTIAAKRLKDALLKKVEGKTIEKVIISSYSNAYMGYITTPEEYVTQSYEAGHTVFGRETLRGFIESFEELAQCYVEDKKSPQEVKPFKFPEEELLRRSVIERTAEAGPDSASSPR